MTTNFTSKTAKTLTMGVMESLSFHFLSEKAARFREIHSLDCVNAAALLKIFSILSGIFLCHLNPPLRSPLRRSVFLSL